MKLKSFVVPMHLLILLLIMLSGPTAFADSEAVIRGPLTCQIEYWSVGHLGERDDDGWLLAWKGNVSGDLRGELGYWFPESPPVPEGAYSDGTASL